MLLPFGDQLGELPRTRNLWSRPSFFITNRSESLVGSPGARLRLLWNTIFLPSGDSGPPASKTLLWVSRRGLLPSGSIR